MVIYMTNFKNKRADIDLIYKTVGNLKLPMQVFLPDGDIHKARTVIAIHGGGWKDAIKDNSEWNGGWMSNNARYLASGGFIGIVISYRSLEVPQELNVCDLLEDICDAIIYIKKHLSFVNFDNIVYMGDSAGGYFTTMLGLSQNDEIRPNKVVSLNPVLGNLDGKWKYGFNNCGNIGAFTPANIVGEKCAEFLFMHGTADGVVEIEYTEELHTLLISNGHKSSFLKIPDAKHAFGLYDYKYSDEFVTGIMEQIIEYIE